MSDPDLVGAPIRPPNIDWKTKKKYIYSVLLFYFSFYFIISLFFFHTGFPLVTFSKEKIESIDEANKTLVYSVIDGETLKYYKSFKGTLIVIPKGNGSLVKWCCEFERANDEIPEPQIIKEFAVKNFKNLDAYLIGA